MIFNLYANSSDEGHHKTQLMLRLKNHFRYIKTTILPAWPKGLAEKYPWPIFDKLSV